MTIKRGNFYVEAYVRGDRQRKVTIPKSLWHIFNVGRKVTVNPVIKGKERTGIIKTVTEEGNGKQRMFTINKEHWGMFPINTKCRVRQYVEQV